MENHEYNSLTNKLIQNGIIGKPDDSNMDNFNIDNIKVDSSSNFFESMQSEIFPQDNPIKPLDLPKSQPTKKRINEYDLNLIRNIDTNQTNPQKAPYKTLKRFLDFKQLCLNNGNSSFFELFLYKFFPKIYTAKLIKKAINKMVELNIDAKTLLDKTIPYGERESRYEDLIKYLNCANELQVKLKRNFN